ncbi:hypothetical protein QF092_17680 [Fuscovulum ytuae]|uniref:Uncharacterized protein n=1 Tax=Fuscovulum ytuae TaxID=3042299 RepID=A0ABY8Q5A6_9RHOB|nr:hypothetical protein [Fuscovulum sp. YMD61]WGV16058.1 hypothetical protein QF092_17680 [Fuscovulum sp. YMD61]
MAASRAVRAAQKLDEYWYHLRINDSDLLGKHMLRMAGNIGVAPSALPMPPAVSLAASVKLSEAVSIYWRLKGEGRPITFQRSAKRSCGYVIDVGGDKDITAYTKADANAFRDDPLRRGLTGSSITRIFGTVRSVINFAASEIGIDVSNPFGKVYYDRNAGVEERVPPCTTSAEPVEMRVSPARRGCDHLMQPVARDPERPLDLAHRLWGDIM